MLAEVKRDGESLPESAPLNLKTLTLGGLALFLIGALTTGCVILEPRHHGRGHGPPAHSSAPHALKHRAVTPLVTPHIAAHIIFDARQRHIIEDYYRSHRMDYDDDRRGKHKKNKKWKKGRGKHKGMPPGLAKKGGRLPPGLQKRAFPRDLESRLPPPPPNTERVIINNQILLLEVGTHLVLDVIELSLHH
ncbi:MAG: hypothetical protein E2O44_02710 [Nitrospina sp.]|nr:MAG: hypothetical protein E2O44_02710 [Nitrospina sp.]